MKKEKSQEMVEFEKKMKEAVKDFIRFNEIAYLNEIWKKSNNENPR